MSGMQKRDIARIAKAVIVRMEIENNIELIVSDLHKKKGFSLDDSISIVDAAISIMDEKIRAIDARTDVTM
jgi:hypothetical protein